MRLLNHHPQNHHRKSIKAYPCVNPSVDPTPGYRPLASFLAQRHCIHLHMKYLDTDTSEANDHHGRSYQLVDDIGFTTMAPIMQCGKPRTNRNHRVPQQTSGSDHHEGTLNPGL
jgi:hypothetical protein